MLPHRLRLRHTRDFERVRRDGETWSNRLVVLGVLPNGRDHNRFGFVVGRQLGKAVNRNRTKRRLRAIAHQQLGDLRPGHDIVIIARKAAAQADFQTLSSAVARLLRRAHLTRKE